MSTDIEQELRELFRDKAGQAPAVTPDVAAGAPQPVLRRARLRQLATVAGSAAIAFAIVVGSVAGLNAVLRGTEDRDVGSAYEVFERTATIEAFTVTSPSDWFLVNHWPSSISKAVGSASETCTIDPSGNEVCVSEPEPAEQLRPLPLGLPVFQLTNRDLGLTANACGSPLEGGTAVLSVAMDAEAAIQGISDPSLRPWPGVTADGTEPCGPGRYTRFTVGGEPFFAWAGFGPDATDEDRATVLEALGSLSVDDAWTPSEPDVATPAYVIAGGTLPDGSPWRLDLRPGPRSPELFLEPFDASELGAEAGHGQDTVVPSIPIEYCCARPDGALGVTFGFVHPEATGVEFRVTDGEGNPTGRVLTGTIVPLPPTLAELDADLFFIDGTDGLLGEVVPLGLPAGSTDPTSIAEPRTAVVELSGTDLGHRWSVSFTGAFAERSACVAVTVEEPYEPFCPKDPSTSLADGSPFLNGTLTPDLFLLAGSVPPEVADIRYAGDDDAIVPQATRCATGPLGWIDPDRKVCVVALPSSGSGTLRYFDADGGLLFEESVAWGAGQATEIPTPAQPTHGGTYWAVYAWVGEPRDREAEDVSARLLQDYGIEAFPGDLACDEGAAEALGTDAEQGIAVYFDSEQDAQDFALAAGLLDHEQPVIAQVTTYCLD